MKKTFCLMLILTATLCGVSRLSGQEFWRVMTADRIRQMNNFERVQYLKALDLLNNRQYRASATEFERFLIQYQASDMKPYIAFMRAYALMQGKDRNQAISVFNEVVDFFPGAVDAAAPALYYRGMAHFANGDYSKGMTSMKELLDHDDYQYHPVAAAASLQLVRNYWRNREPEKANLYLKQIFDNFHQKSPKTAEAARNFYVAACLSTGKVQEYQSWYMEAYAEAAAAKKIKPAEFRVNMVSLAYDLVLWSYGPLFQSDDLITKYRGGKKSGSDPFVEAWKLLEKNKGSFEKADQLWGYYERAARLLAPRRIVKDAEFERLISDACKFISETPDAKKKGQQQNRYKLLTRILIDSNRLDQALYVNNRIQDKKQFAWNEYDVMIRRGKWTDALAHLDRMLANFKDDAALVKQAGWRKADLLRDRMSKYDEAIQVYRSIGDPPNSLWSITECHKRKKDVKSVIQQLIEIENGFPDHGARAAWDRASYYNGLGNGKMAVKEGRYIMKKYPKSQQASWAHQLLEKYGVDTGGGVEDDM